MLIPSIDLMGGKIVQLVQGKEKKLEFENFEEWAQRFRFFPLVQLIDLDAAMGHGRNDGLLEFFLKKLPCQVGGGIRSIDDAHKLLALGAQRVILGSALIQNGEINVSFARQLADEIEEKNLVLAIDARNGKVAIKGWRVSTSISPVEMATTLEPYCGAFLYTHIDTEGLMLGIPLEPVCQLRQATTRQLIVAGGISTRREIEMLHDLGIDAVAGMALYLGKLDLPDTIPVSE